MIDFSSLDVDKLTVIEMVDTDCESRAHFHIKHALKIFNTEKDKWYLLMADSVLEKMVWMAAFRAASVVVLGAEAVQQPATTAKYRASEMTMTDTERIRIMTMVRWQTQTLGTEEFFSLLYSFKKTLEPLAERFKIEGLFCS